MLLLSCSFLSGLWTPPPHGHYSQGDQGHCSYCNPDLHISTCLFLFLSMRSKRPCLSIKSLSTCVRKPSKHFRKFLDWWCPAVLSFQLSCDSRPTWGPGPANMRLLPDTWRRHHLLLHPDQTVYSRHPKQCHPLIPTCFHLAHHPSRSKTSHIPAFSHPKGNSPSLPALPKEPVLIHCSTPATWDIPPHLSKPKETYAFKKKEIKFLYMYNLSSHKHKFKERYSMIIMSFHRLLATDQTSVFQAYGCIMIETIIEQWNSAQKRLFPDIKVWYGKNRGTSS